jgi:hypothetical protein
MAVEETSLIIRTCSAAKERVHVYLDTGSNLVVMDSSGACEGYDGKDGSPLGPCAAPVVHLLQMDSQPEPPHGKMFSNFWSVGNGRWFCWVNENHGGGRDGSAWLYEPKNFEWIELPQAHHHQVWFAVGLSSGGFASLGMNSNIGALVVWASPHEPEIITIPHGPRGNQAGIVELTDGSLLVWPFKDDGSAAYFKGIEGTEKFRKIWFLRGMEEIVGAISMPPNQNGQVRFVTWTETGEVRLLTTEHSTKPFLHRSSRLGEVIHTPHHLNRIV